MLGRKSWLAIAGGSFGLGVAVFFWTVGAFDMNIAWYWCFASGFGMLLFGSGLALISSIQGFEG